MAGAGPTKKTEADGQEFVFPADAASCQQVHAQIMEITTRAGFGDEAQLEIDLAVQEALANAMIHGCKRDAHQQIRCVVRVDAEGAVITVSDPGPGFDPASVPDPLSEQGQGRFSGRGVLFIRSVMDDVTYARGGAEITMRKRR